MVPTDRPDTWSCMQLTRTLKNGEESCVGVSREQLKQLSRQSIGKKKDLRALINLITCLYYDLKN